MDKVKIFLRIYETQLWGTELFLLIKVDFLGKFAETTENIK